MPGNLQFHPIRYLEIVQNEYNQHAVTKHLIPDDSGQDMSACQISGHFFQVFCRKCLEPPTNFQNYVSMIEMK